MKIFAIGDIHGRYKALKEVLKKSKFDYQKNKLIVMGDIVDGGPDTKKCVDELLKIKNLVYILGNHDLWCMDWMKTGKELPIWYHQGGIETIRSYGGKYKSVPKSHKKFFDKGKYWHIEDDMIFVHGGFNPKIPKMESQSKFDLVWDRHLIQYARKGNVVPNYKHVFVGHTTTQIMGGDALIEDISKPLTFKNLTMLDVGAGTAGGKLCIMDIHTKEYWLSKTISDSRIDRKIWFEESKMQTLRGD